MCPVGPAPNQNNLGHDKSEAGVFAECVACAWSVSDQYTLWGQSVYPVLASCRDQQQHKSAVTWRLLGHDDIAPAAIRWGAAGRITSRSYGWCCGSVCRSAGECLFRFVEQP